MRVVLEVRTPVHISSPERIPSAFWMIKGDRVAVLDVESLADAVGIDGIAHTMEKIVSNKKGGKFHYSSFYRVLDGVRAQPGRAKGDLYLFIRDGGGDPYIPGSSMKGSLRTAVLGSAISSNAAARESFLNFVSRGHFRNPKTAFSTWYGRYVAGAHYDPFRAVHVSDGRIVSGKFEVFPVERRHRSKRFKLPAGGYEFLLSGRVEFELSFDGELWTYLSNRANGLFSSISISLEKDLLQIWTDWTSKVLSWLRSEGVAGIPGVGEPVVLGRHTGWTTKTLAYVLKDVRPCPPMICRGRRRSWPLPATYSLVNRKFPGILEVV